MKTAIVVKRQRSETGVAPARSAGSPVLSMLNMFSQGSQPTRSHEQATGRTANSESSTRRAPKEPAHDFNALFQEDLRRGRKRPLAHSVITLSDSAGPPQRQLNMVLS